MNMNVKLDGEDEQAVHFPNRATIALQTAPAAYINLNIVNPNLSNSGYILNPVSSVGQNLVAYQAPVTLQSYIALQEADGNIVNNLQVGVPVPIGLPVPAELLQNSNLVNTSIIIGNEDCNQPVIFKPATNNVPETNDLKIGYMQKPIMQEVKPSTQEDPNMRLTDITGMSLESVLKKPCPLEMSIKAANIDLEFEKCDPEELIPDSNGLLQTPNYPVIQKLPIENQMAENVVLNVPVTVPEKPAMEVPVIRQTPEVKKQKTEITWENDCLQNQDSSDDFRECLICEVEEANDDEDDAEDEKSDDSSDGSETLPLGVVLKLRRVQDSDKDGSNKKAKDSQKSSKQAGKGCNQKKSDPRKFLKVRHCCSKRECFKNISLRDQRIAHRNFYDLKYAAKQDAYLLNCIEHVQTNRSLLDGENAKDSNETSYKPVDDDDRTLLEAANIQLEIENESNGNQMLSDEIQKAIKESLKDCMANQAENKKEVDPEEKRMGSEEAKGISNDEDEKIQNWNFYLVIDRCRKRVCLKFLLKLFRITKNRIKSLQEKILSGHPLSDDSSFNVKETFDAWDFARIHLNTLASEEHPCCRYCPPHRYLVNESSLEHLYDTFKDFYKDRAHKELTESLSSYKSFLQNETIFSLSGMKPGSCSKCDALEGDTTKNKNETAKLDRSFQTRKKGRKKWEISSDSECSSDDEPLAKRKNLRLKILLKGGNKVQTSEKNDSADESRKAKRNSKRDTRGKGGNGVRGRDVWSLMLLHLETMPYKICKNCVSRKKHRFFDASMTKQALYEDYRRYFLKETNSELGLGFTMYEKYFDRNCGYTIGEVDVNSPVCPRCALEPPKPETTKSSKKTSKNCNNNVKIAHHMVRESRPKGYEAGGGSFTILIN